MARWLVMGVPMFVLGVLGGIGASRAHEKTANAAPAMNVGRCSANEAEVASSRAEVRELQTLLRSAYAATAGDSRGDAHPSGIESPEVNDPPSPSLTPAEEKAWLAARSKFFDGLLEKEARDVAWAGPIEAKANRIAASMKDRGVKLDDARCWSDHCRMVFSFRDGDPLREHLQHLVEAFVELPQIAYAYPGEPPGAQVILYMSKPGASLPEFDDQSFIADSRGRER